MTDGVSSRPRWAIGTGILAVVFGVVTVFEGGRMLFARPEIRASAGNIVPFVLWFNFIAGFAYLMAGFGLLLWKRWAAQVSAGIAITTLSVFAAFGVHVALGALPHRVLALDHALALTSFQVRAEMHRCEFCKILLSYANVDKIMQIFA